MKKRIWLICGLAALALTAGLLPQSSGKGIAYRVSGGRNPMVLLGSIHVGSREMYPFASGLQKALDEADAFVFECDTKSADAARLTAQMMQLSSGSLQDLISPEVYEKLAQTAEKYRFDFNALQNLKPWAVVSMLSMETAADGMGARNASAAAALGVENRVHAQVKDRPKLYLETVQEQLETLNGMSAPLQMYLLESACDDLLDGKIGNDTSKWPDWWREGNADAFADSYQQELKAEKQPELAREYHEALMTRRNVLMAERLARLLEDDTGRSYFVTVGLMHLVLPDDSVLSALEAMGYTIEPLS